jgi:tetratricopeptide (TPR) repeat protein
VAEHPQVPEYRQELAMTHNNLGNLLQATGRVAEAEKAYRQALQLRERLVAEHPQVPQYRQELATTHNNLGVLLQATGRVAEAEKAYRQALQLREQLVAEHPQVPRIPPGTGHHAQQPGRVAASHRSSGRGGKSLSPSLATV